MADNTFFPIEAIPYRRWFPWLRLSEAFQIALNIRNMTLAFLGIILMYSGHFLLSQAIPSSVIVESSRISIPELNDEGRSPGLPFLFSDSAYNVPLPVGNLTHVLWRPYRQILFPAERLFFPPGRLGGESSWADIAAAWSLLLWDLVVWSLCGGAITRQAASRFTQRRSLPLGETLRYSRSFFLSYFSAPLLPFVAIGTLFVLNRLIGLFALIPGDNNVVIGVLWFIPLILSLLMAIVIFCISLCWPLMFPAISVQGSDAFDGMSRAYGYLTGQPWQMAWYVVVALVFGVVMIALVQLIMMLTIYLSIWSAAWLWQDEMRRALEQQIPLIFGGSGSTHFPFMPTSGQEIMHFWMEAMSWLFMAFVYSYFWSVTTIIYFLLRRSSDGIEMTDMYFPRAPEPEEATTVAPSATVSTPESEIPSETSEPRESPPLE